MVAPDVIRAGADAPEPAADWAPAWVAGGTPEPLRSQLTAGLGPDRVLTPALDLIAYASDAGAYRMIPRAVALPHDVGDIVRLLKLAGELHGPLVFRAGGTSLNGQSQTDSIPARTHRTTVALLGADARGADTPMSRRPFRRRRGS